MTNYVLAADRGTGAEKIYEVAKHLKKCAGGTVKTLGIGPSVLANYGLSNGKGCVGVYMTNGVGLATPNDFNLGCKPGGYYKYDKTIFVWPQFIDNQWMSDKNIKQHKIPGEWDWNRASSYNVGGQTAAQWFPKAQYVDLVAGTSPADIAQRICNGAFVTSEGNPSSNSLGNYSSSGGSSDSSSSSSSGQSDSNVSPLLQGDMTFEELVGDICNGIDLMFLTKKSVVVVDDFSSIYAQAKYLRDKNSKVVEGENIQLWQLEEDSYELEVNQHGFYNTVYVKYKNGVVRESYDEFVRVYGEIPITYKEPKLDKVSATMKAKSYLSAHIRDFGMTVNLSMLANGSIDIGDIVTVENPQTLTNKIRTSKGRDPEYLFVDGVTTDWEGDGYITTDLELKFAPTSPKNAEVPTSGISTGSNKSNSANSSSENKTSGKTFNSCGVSSDGQTLCAIGKPSAAGESHYGYRLYRSLFKRKCPFCGSDKLFWGYMWNGNFPCTKVHNNGTDGRYEGHIYCDGCDADFSCIDGKDHMNPPRARLTRMDSGPVKVSESDAYKLKKGQYRI